MPGRSKALFIQKHDQGLNWEEIERKRLKEWATDLEISPNLTPGFSSMAIRRTSAEKRMYAVTSFLRPGVFVLFCETAGLADSLANREYEELRRRLLLIKNVKLVEISHLKPTMNKPYDFLFFFTREGKLRQIAVRHDGMYYNMYTFDAHPVEASCG